MTMHRTVGPGRELVLNLATGLTVLLVLLIAGAVFNVPDNVGFTVALVAAMTVTMIIVDQVRRRRAR